MLGAHHAHVKLVREGDVGGEAAAARTSGGSSSRSTDCPIHLFVTQRRAPAPGA